MNHRELCELGGRWLRRNQRCSLVLVDVRGQRTEEQPDVIGWHNCIHSRLIEVKVSRADFRADKDKPHRKAGRQLGQRRWYLAPKGVIPHVEVPKDWGLLEEVNGKVYQRLTPPKARFSREIFFHEFPLLLNQLEKASWGRPPQVLSLVDFHVPDCSDAPWQGDSHRAILLDLLSGATRWETSLARLEDLEGMPLADALALPRLPRRLLRGTRSVVRDD